MSKDFRSNTIDYAKYLIGEYAKLMQNANKYKLAELTAELDFVSSSIAEELSQERRSLKIDFSRYQELEKLLITRKKDCLSTSGIFFRKQPKLNGLQPIYMYHSDIDKLEVFNPDGNNELLNVTLEELERNYISVEDFVTKANENAKVYTKYGEIKDAPHNNSRCLLHGNYCFKYVVGMNAQTVFAMLTTCDEAEIIERVEREGFKLNQKRFATENDRLFYMLEMKQYFVNNSLVRQIRGPKK